jgi:hypothetical protein
VEGQKEIDNLIGPYGLQTVSEYSSASFTILPNLSENSEKTAEVLAAFWQQNVARKFETSHRPPWALGWMLPICCQIS